MSSRWFRKYPDKNVYNKGYHITEATILTGINHPVSIFPEIHFSKEKNFTSINNVNFSAMEWARALFGKATFVMDCGYDNNKMFLELDSMKQSYVIRLTVKRKLLYHNKRVFATELRSRRKGKVKTSFLLLQVNKSFLEILFKKIKFFYFI